MSEVVSRTDTTIVLCPVSSETQTVDDMEIWKSPPKASTDGKRAAYSATRQAHFNRTNSNLR